VAKSPERALVEVWMEMANHFLDTETRHGLPRTALRCLQAGLDADSAREIWHCDVEPAVGYNLRAVAGEWSGWDETWLVSRIAETRLRRMPTRWKRWLWNAGNGTCASLERFITALSRLSETEQPTAADTLCEMACQYFALAPKPLAGPRCVALRDTFLEAIKPATLAEERVSACARLDAALAAFARARS
jgi:hypothetical protein